MCAKRWGIAWVTLAVAALGPVSAEPVQPNILFILADDLGCVDLSCYGSDLYRTPHLDRFAGEGLRFTRAYAACPVCSPTRASIMTGKYPARLHLTDWIPGSKRPNEILSVPAWQKGLPAAEQTIAELLKPRGYATAWFGKWHLGGRPTDHGFDAGNEDYALNKKEDGEDPKGVFTLTREALAFMKQNRARPFFVGVSHYAVHTPVRFNTALKKACEQRVKPGGLQTNAGYAAMVEVMDESVGQLLKGLAELDLADRTLVVFFSDNGGLEGPTNNDPMRAGKGTLYEGGIRVPMIVRWPGRVRAGAETGAVVCSVDFLPTFLEAAGASAALPPRVDGMSLVPLFTRAELPARDALYWHYPHYHRGKPGGGIRRGDLKLIEFFEDERIELYDLAADPGEQRNLAMERPAEAAAILAELRAWRKAVDAQMMSPNPAYQPPGKRAAP